MDHYSAMKTPEGTNVSYFCLRKRKVLSSDLSTPMSAAQGQAGGAGSVEERVARIVAEAREATIDAQRARAELAKVHHTLHSCMLARLLTCALVLHCS